VLYWNQGKHDVAEPLYISCLEASQRVLGDEHPDTLGAMNNLAGLLQSQGKYELAEPLLINCLEARRNVLGDEHADTITSMNNLAIVYQVQGKLADAEEMFAQCVEVARKVYGDDHPQVAHSAGGLAAGGEHPRRRLRRGARRAPSALHAEWACCGIPLDAKG
jgi:tetratricopeptide (TPR) repeat protein